MFFDTELNRLKALLIKNKKILIFILLIIIILAGYTRLLKIESDPPSWQPVTFLIDGGWWTNGARGKILFNDYKSQDFGMSFLITPGYTLILKNVYSFFDIGQKQANALSSICQLLTIIIFAFFIYKSFGIKESIIATLLLSISPFYMSYGRIGIPEPTQSLFIIISVSIWLLMGNKRIGAFITGVILSFAISIKLNAILTGLIPLIISGAITLLITGKINEIDSKTDNNKFFKSLLFFFIGLTMGLVILFITVISSDINSFLALFQSEGGIESKPWWDQISFITQILISKIYIKGDPWPVMWNAAHWSPAIISGLWLYLLSVLIQWHYNGRQIFKKFNSIEIFCLAWVILSFLVIFIIREQEDYRYLMPFPAFAILSTFFITKYKKVISEITLHVPNKEQAVQHGRIFGCIFWLIFLLPLMIILKPLCIKIVMELGKHWQFGRSPGLGMGSAGLPFMGIWLLIILALSWKPGVPIKLCRTIISHFSIPIIVVFLMFEIFVSISYFQQADTTLINAQNKLSSMVEEGDTVAGRFSATLCHTSKANTARRLSPKSPPMSFRPQILIDKLNPKYVIVPDIWNFQQYLEPESTVIKDIKKAGYQKFHHINIGTVQKDKSQFEFLLFKKIEKVK